MVHGATGTRICTREKGGGVEGRRREEGRGVGGRRRRREKGGVRGYQVHDGFLFLDTFILPWQPKAYYTTTTTTTTTSPCPL